MKLEMRQNGAPRSLNVKIEYDYHDLNKEKLYSVWSKYHNSRSLTIDSSSRVYGIGSIAASLAHHC